MHVLKHLIIAKCDINITSALCEEVQYDNLEMLVEALSTKLTNFAFLSTGSFRGNHSLS